MKSTTKDGKLVTLFKIENKGITRNWVNGFGQSCYQLEDGTILAISITGTDLQVFTPVKEAK